MSNDIGDAFQQASDATRSSAATTVPLLPCPFCGKAPHVEDDKDGICSLSCDNADCIGVEVTCPTLEDAREFWNRRDGLAQAPIEPVAWRVKNDFGHWYVTQHKDLADTWRDFEGYEVQGLYAAQPPVASVETKSDGAGENQPEQRTGPHRASGETNSGATGDSELTRSARLPSDTRCSADSSAAPLVWCAVFRRFGQTTIRKASLSEDEISKYVERERERTPTLAAFWTEETRSLNEPQTAPNRDVITRIINGIYGIGSGTYAGGHQDKSIARAVDAILAAVKS